LAKLNEAILSGAKLSGANLTSASVAGAHLDNADLTDAKYAPNSPAPDARNTPVGIAEGIFRMVAFDFTTRYGLDPGMISA
jgi:Pentapeptide repeats (8 copies)